MAQLNESHGRVKAPPRTDNINVLRDYVANLADMFAKLAKDLDFIINGNLDVKNIRANSITADRLKVDELSAISANLGHITAGLIEAVTMIGSLIMTSQPGDFPRAEMSSTDKMFKVQQGESNYAEFRANYNAAGGITVPALRFVRGADYMDVGGIGPGGIFGIHSYNDLYLLAYGSIYQFLTYFPDWSFIRNQNSGKSLDQELSEIKESINALTSLLNSKAESGVSTGSAGGGDGGIPIGTQLATAGGGSVTWTGINSHSHTQI